ncbi:ABC transporter permease [Paenibacillus sp. CAA11]|nr:ABC transporter permease [Paenibacillus sp. CAA11]
MLWVGSVMLLFLLLVTFVGPYMSIIDRELKPVPYHWGPNNKLILPPYKYSADNPLGSDKKGVDNLSRLIVGAKLTLMLTVSIALIRYFVGVPLGLFARKKRGLAHHILGVMNMVFSYIPPILAAALFISLPLLVHQPLRLFWIVVFLGIIEAGRVGYLVQQQTFSVSQEPFVEAGNALGLSPRRLSLKYYLPAIMPDLIVNFCLDLGKCLLLLGQLGVLGFFLTQRFSNEIGMVNISNDWGGMLASHTYDIFVSKFQNVLIPAFAMLYAILTFNVFGEGLRHHFNRRSSSSKTL